MGLFLVVMLEDYHSLVIAESETAWILLLDYCFLKWPKQPQHHFSFGFISGKTFDLIQFEQVGFNVLLFSEGAEEVGWTKIKKRR